MASPREIVQSGWKPLLEGRVKLNTDDCCRDNGLAGCGGFIRRSDGEWLVTLLNVLVCVAPIWHSIVEYLKV